MSRKEQIIKSIALSKAKVVEATDGSPERRVVFVASSNQEDRDYETVDIGTFRLPLKGGGSVVAKELPEGGLGNIDIPLLTDHAIEEVDKVIGSVRNAKFANNELVIEAGISNRPYAQDVFKLVEEGHLDNAFSIRFRDYDWNPDADSLSKGEIIEISLVVRGSNKEARVMEVKSTKGESMPHQIEAEKTAEETAPNPPEASGTAAEAKNENAEAETAETTNEDKEKSMSELNHTEVAKANFMPKPSQAETSNDVAKNYLSTKGAVLDFAKISKSCGGDPTGTKSIWLNHLKAKGVTISDGTSFMPTEIEQVMFKAWHDAIGALATFRRTRAKMTRFYAATTTSRALGHTKGQTKADQDVTFIPRTANLRVIFKKLPLDWIDIVNDDSGELYVFRTRELVDRLKSEIVRGAILGDGRSEPTQGAVDNRVFVDGEGLYSIAADINASGTANSYASAVATLIPNTSSDDVYAQIVKTLAKVSVPDGSDRRKVLVVPEGTMANLLLEKNENGGRLYPVGTDFREVFKVAEIVEFPATDMAAEKLNVIAYLTGAYTLGGPEATVRNWFDGNTNKDYMMVEQPVLGSLEGHKVAAGYAAPKVDLTK